MKKNIFLAIALIILFGVFVNTSYVFAVDSDNAELYTHNIEVILNQLLRGSHPDEQSNVIPGKTITPEQAGNLLWRLVFNYYGIDYQSSPYLDRAYSGEGLTKEECDSILFSAIGDAYSGEFATTQLISFQNGKYVFQGASGDTPPELNIIKTIENNGNYEVHFDIGEVIDWDSWSGEPTYGVIGSGVAVAYANPKSVFGVTITQFTPFSTDIITAQPDIGVTLNGTPLTFDQPPIIQDGRTLVALRAIVEAMGMEVAWDEADQSITIAKGNNEIKLVVGNQTAYKNGTEIRLDVPPMIMNGRTLVPVRFIAEGFGAVVDWDDAEQMAVITY